MATEYLHQESFISPYKPDGGEINNDEEEKTDIKPIGEPPTQKPSLPKGDAPQDPRKSFYEF